MIAVIADDFTGAAELAGICLRYGLTVELCVAEVQYNNADVLIISTDSRSLGKDTALLKTGTLIKEVLELRPTLIYKKIDSALRGYVIDELKLQMRLMRRERGIVMPANPELGRIIKNGEYFVNGIAISETSFANDPEFPINSSLVKEIWNQDVEVLTTKDPLPGQGIAVGEAERQGDYATWAEKLDKSWVLAGAGDFFTAILEKNHSQVVLEEVLLQQPFLYVCGTAFKERKQAIKQIQELKKCVCYLKNENDDVIVNEGIEILNANKPLILAFDDDTVFLETAGELRSRMASVVRQLIDKGEVKDLFIEGGATTAAILNTLHIKMLEPVNELSRGVVRMKAGNLFITVKPGSYKLPDEIRNIYFTN